jgi:hypothetical protein
MKEFAGRIAVVAGGGSGMGRELLIDTTATALLPGPQNPRECHLYIAEGCHLYIVLTVKSRRRWILENWNASAVQITTLFIGNSEHIFC